MSWPIERILFALAGTMTLVAALLSAIVSPWFLLLAAFVGVNQWLYVATGACPASLVLRSLISDDRTRTSRSSPAERGRSAR
jgi:hypothetical protein